MSQQPSGNQLDGGNGGQSSVISGPTLAVDTIQGYTGTTTTFQSDLVMGASKKIKTSLAASQPVVATDASSYLVAGSTTGTGSTVVLSTQPSISQAFIPGATGGRAIGSGATVNLTATSSEYQQNTYTGGAAVYTLPDATTMLNGAKFIFENNQTSTSMKINNKGGSQLYSIPASSAAGVAGNMLLMTLISNSTTNGTWAGLPILPGDQNWFLDASLGGTGANNSGYTLSMTGNSTINQNVSTGGSPTFVNSSQNRADQKSRINSAGTTTLTSSDVAIQIFPAGANSTCLLPDETTIPVGATYVILAPTNSGFTLQDSAGTTLCNLATSQGDFRCISKANGAATGNWYIELLPGGQANYNTAANLFLASPSSTTGPVALRTIAAADVPSTLNATGFPSSAQIDSSGNASFNALSLLGAGNPTLQVKIASGTLTTAQLRSLHSVPVYIVSGAGAGTFIFPISLTASFVSDGTAFSADPAISFGWGGSFQLIYSNLDMTLNGTASTILGRAGGFLNQPTTAAIAQGVYFQSASDITLGGTSHLNYCLLYAVIGNVSA